MSALKLHLGCGNVHLDGFVNIDSRYQPGVDVVDNIGILKQYAPRSVAEIYCCHALDHFSRWDYPRVLQRWSDLLAPGGRLRISTVNFESIVWAWQNGTPAKDLIGCLYAAQDYESNLRKVMWDFPSLEHDLLATGFTRVVEYESTLNDCSTYKVWAGDQSRPLSLNVEATKGTP